MRILLILSIIFINCKLLISGAIASDATQEIFTCLGRKDWQECDALVRSSRNPVLTKIITSQKFLDSNYSNNRFEDVVKFIQANPHWPQTGKLKTTAEKYLNNNTNHSVIVNWFNKHEPSTGQGYKFYALASGALTKDPKKIERIIKNGWVYGDFTTEEENKYISKFKNILSEEDHIKKVDEYLWKGDVTNAKKYMRYVNNNSYKQNFTAQIATINKSNNSESLFKQVSAKYYTQGLLYNYLSSRKKETPTNRSIELFKKVKADRLHSPEWYKLQSYYAREFIDHKDFASSYKIISLPITTHHEGIRETEWFSGWLALRFLNKPDAALYHFGEFIKVAKRPMSVSRGLYWLGRTYAAKGNKGQENQYYHKAAEYSYTFYGQLANVELKKNQIILPNNRSSSKHDGSNEVIKAIKYLIKYDKPDLGLLYAKEAMEKSTKPLEIALITEIIGDNCSTYHKVEAAKTACQQHTFIKECAYPTPHVAAAKNAPVETALVYSIIRQESVFNQHAVSSAKAMGLMQLIEKTACDTARSISHKCDVRKLTSDPLYNIKLGGQHLRELLDKFDNSYILTIISYNAGAHRAKQWVERFGDPRHIKSLQHAIDWIELIPYSETRNYVQRVLENLQVYRAILNKNNTLKLKSDLLR
ncbi:MAG: lytic transglycosylase domain-containing protein [Candidatus Rickettsia vulgarisii]